MACRPVSRHGGTVLRGLTIEAGEISGTTTVSVTPLAGGDKKRESFYSAPMLRVISQWDSDLDLLIVWQTDLPPLERALEARKKS